MDFKNKTYNLSIAEIEVLVLIKEGLTSAEISKRRYCSTRTVEKHRSNIIKKLKLQSSPNALIIWTLKNSKCFNT
jgi:DNA-binding CsgD family transcriptional regulator